MKIKQNSELDEALINEMQSKLFVDRFRDTEFYFQKAVDLLIEFENYPIEKIRNEIIQLTEGIQDNRKNKFSYQALIDETNSEDVRKLLELLGRLISIFDTNGYNKKEWNPYDDKRAIASAGVRQNDWTLSLLQYRLSDNDITSINNSRFASVAYTIQYLKLPAHLTNFSSPNYREQIRNYFQLENDTQIVEFFKDYTIGIKNEKNIGAVITALLDSPNVKKFWFEGIVGLMASDGTVWKDEFIDSMKDNYGIIWNSRGPSGKESTIKSLRAIINEGRSFNLYYCSGGMVNYKATVIDFAVNQVEFDQMCSAVDGEKFDYKEKIYDYNIDTKAAKILFLIKNFQKITPIEVSKFIFYKDFKKPTQDNLAPISKEPEFEFTPPIINVNSEYVMNTDIPLNQILYGPPGTGKTFSTISKALKIINPSFKSEDRKILKSEFDRLLKEGQIVFTTFHQSMSYEDFIEGIKPVAPQSIGEVLTYKVQPGILKLICERIINIEKLTSNNFPLGIPVTNFSQLYSAFIDRLKIILSELDENETHYFQSRNSKVKLLKIENDKITTTGETANATEIITKDRLEKIYNRFKSPDDIKNIAKQIREVGTELGWTTNYFAVFKAIKEFEESIKLIDNNKIHSNHKQNYVLIIDEINRGNVSQIFGELITLIEDDKRLGKSEALEISLPYSKEKFGVPPNLYIIGTMNTADRSVEALDAALRRRFSFIAMPPKPEIIAQEGILCEYGGIIDGISMPELLKVINLRIEKLLDKDHQIGHSYFMSVKSLDDLKHAFQDKILPLLQEYFFGDYGKIGLVLGDGFVEVEKDVNGANIFATFKGDNGHEYEDRIIYNIKEIDNLTAADFINVYSSTPKS